MKTLYSNRQFYHVYGTAMIGSLENCISLKNKDILTTMLVKS